MKVTFTCEECGEAVYVGEHLENGAELDQLLDNQLFFTDKHRVGLPACPNCAKLTYGPLTEEMVADALIECTRSHNEVEDDYFECEARFVLRLLQNEKLAAYPPSDDTLDWRGFLLDLARQK